MKIKKVIVVLPAYNAEKTLIKTVKKIPKNIVNEIILVDDGSTDKTYLLAKKINLLVFKHKKNLGYGANQKTCYQLALKRKADIIVMIHPDYQYDPKLIPYFVNLIKDNYFDVVLGSRIRSRKEALSYGMPLYKYLANRFLSFIENIITGYNLSEWHTGMRAYKSEVLKNIDFKKNSNGFVFDTQVLFQIIEKGYRIGEISIPTSYNKDASSISFFQSIKYGLETLFVAFKFLIKNFLNHLKI